MGRPEAARIAIRQRGGCEIIPTESRVPGPVVWGEADAELVAKAQAGDVGAFGELVRRYSRTVYGVVSRMAGNPDDVDDIAQEVFVRAYRSIGSFRGDAEFSTWLYRIAVNTTIKLMNKIRSREVSSVDDPASGLADMLVSSQSEQPDKIVERRERNEALRKAVGDLPEKHRTVVVLHYFENLACEEIAKMVGCSVGTVWSRLHYACKKLHASLGCDL